MKPSDLLLSTPTQAPESTHAAPATPDAPPADRGVAVRVVREGDGAEWPAPTAPTLLRAFLSRFQGAGLSAETLSRALALPPSLLAAFADSSDPPRWFLMALGGLAAAHGVPAADLEWLRKAAEQAE